MPLTITEREWLEQVLLFCGVLAPAVYLTTDRLAGKLLSGYSFTSHSMSELSAVGASTRSLTVWLNLVAAVLMISFGAGVWRMGGQALLPRIVGGFVIANAVLGLIGIFFFPTHFGERPNFFTPGVITMFLSVVCFVLAMCFGVAAYTGWLRILSIGIPVSYVLLTLLRFAAAASSHPGGDMSLIGAQERTMAYSFLFWVLALVVYLLLSMRSTAPPQKGFCKQEKRCLQQATRYGILLNMLHARFFLHLPAI